MPDRTIHMIGHAHLDPVWLWPWQEGYQEARATFWSAIHRMAEYPDFVFTCDQMVLLSWVEESDPELFDQIRQRVAEGRWVNVGGWWVEPDCNLPNGESFVRQGLLGQRYLQSRFGRTATVGMNADPFGHHAMLPQILRGQGMDAYTFLRPGPHESDLGDDLFWWQSADGSRVLAWRIPFEYASGDGSVAWQTEKSLGRLSALAGDVMVFYGVGNHGGGPTRANIDSIHRFDAMGTFGRMTLSSPPAFFDAVTAAHGADGLARLPVRQGDLQHHAPGCYSAHSGIKAWMRRAQAAVLNAERWATVVSGTHGVPAPRAELARAWQQVLFNQFHDILPGSAIEPAYQDAHDQLGEAVSIAKRVLAHAHNVIARRVGTAVATAQPVLVFNPHPWPVTADVELHYGGFRDGAHVVDAAGRRTPSQDIQSAATTDDETRGAVVFRAEVPALGYRLYDLQAGRSGRGAPAMEGALPSRTAAGVVLENRWLRAEVDPDTGWLVALLDKRTGIDVLAGGGGAHGAHALVAADPTDTWGHRVVSYALGGEPMTTTRILLREHGELRDRLMIERSWGRSTLREELVLSRDADAIEVRVTLDWREPGHLLKLRFPTALESPVATFEVPFGHLERPVDGAEEPAQSWVDLTGIVDGRPAGLAVVNDAKHGYDVSPAGTPTADSTPSIGITAVRSPVYAWHDPRPLDPAGTYSYQDQGVQRFTYLLVPHGGDWRAAGLMRRAAELGMPVRAMLEARHDGDLPAEQGFIGVRSSGPGEVLVSAVKVAEDPVEGGADVVVRAYEADGSAGRTTARIELPFLGRAWEADFGPSQIRTFLVPHAAGRPVVEVDLIEWPVRLSGGELREIVEPAEPAEEDAGPTAAG